MTKKAHPPRISGVFTQKIITSIGTGTTARKTESLSYFLAQEQEDGSVEVQNLGPENLPFGEKAVITRDELLEKYLPEPQRSLEFVHFNTARQREITKSVARGDKFLGRGETFTAEFEYSKALALDEAHVRANFGIGLCYTTRGDQAKAREVFQRLVKLDAAFKDEHKHLFNEFGIALRKEGMQEEALAFYARGAELSPDDENLHYNMARAAYEQGQAELAAKHLCECLRLSPVHIEAGRFMDYLVRKNLAERPCA